MSAELILVPVSLREANAFVEKVHRHHGPTRGHKFAVAAGWVRDGETRAQSWDRASRARTDKHPTGVKVRWVAGR